MPTQDQPPEGPVPCGQCGATSPPGGFDDDPQLAAAGDARCADVLACLDRRRTGRPLQGERIAGTISDLTDGQTRTLAYLLGINAPAAVLEAIRQLQYAEDPPVAHDVRVRRSGTGLTVYCDPCEWRVHVESGRTPGALLRLAIQHAGGE